MSYILTSAGNIPVDRKTKDRQELFSGTLETLSQGAAVALFPEGPSYTDRIMQVKDGAAWAALEYTRWLREPGHRGEPLAVVPTAIVYTDKSKYRSRVSNHSMLRLRRVDSSAGDHGVSRSALSLTFIGLLTATSRFGRPITMEPFIEQFLSPEEGAARAAVKRLTATIERELVEATINALDW